MNERFGVKLPRKLAKLMREAFVHLSDEERRELDENMKLGATLGALLSLNPGAMIGTRFLGDLSKDWQRGRILATMTILTHYEYWETRCVANTAQEINSAIEQSAKVKRAKPLPQQETWLPGATRLYIAHFLPKIPILLAIKEEPVSADRTRLTISAVSYEGRFWKHKTYRTARHLLREFAAELDARLRQTTCD